MCTSSPRPRALSPGAGRRRARVVRPTAGRRRRVAREMDDAGVHATIMVQGHGAYSYDNSYCADARASRARSSRERVDHRHDATRPQRTAHLLDAAGHGRHTPVPHPDSREAVARRRSDVAVLAPDRTTSACGPTSASCAATCRGLRRLLEWAPPVPISLDHCGLIEIPGFEPTPRAARGAVRARPLPQRASQGVDQRLHVRPQIGLTPAALGSRTGRRVRRRSPHVVLRLAAGARPSVHAIGAERHRRRRSNCPTANATATSAAPRCRSGPSSRPARRRLDDVAHGLMHGRRRARHRIALT